MPTRHRIYYWANIIVNSLLMLLAFVEKDRAVGWLMDWVAVSAVLNPKTWGYAVTLGASLGLAAVWLGCWLGQSGVNCLHSRWSDPDWPVGWRGWQWADPHSKCRTVGNCNRGAA